MHLTRLQFRLVFGSLVVALGTLISGAAIAATMSGPPVTSAPGAVGPYYSGPIHECASIGNENAVYVEEHSDQLGNCAAGYRQLVVNELTPKFTLELGSTAYTCSADTAAAETAITCSVPTPST